MTAEPPHYVMDASAFLASVFEDEAGHDRALALVRDHAYARIQLRAPTLLSYEVSNAVLSAVRAKRPSRALRADTARRILKDFKGLRIPEVSIDPEQLLEVAQRYGRTAYDAAYVAVAEADSVPLITGDLRLLNALRGEDFRVMQVQDYDGETHAP